MNETAALIIPILVLLGGIGVPTLLSALTLKKAKLSYGWLFVNFYPAAGLFVVFGSLLRAAKLKDKYFTQVDGYSVNLKHGLIKCCNCDHVKKLGKKNAINAKNPCLQL